MHILRQPNKDTKQHIWVNISGMHCAQKRYRLSLCYKLWYMIDMD